MVILVDLDDTIECLLDAWCLWLDKTYSTNVRSEDITEWNVCKFFPSLTEDQVYAPLKIDDFWATVRPKHNAMEYLRKIHEDGDEIYILTSSSFETIKSKFYYVIQRYFPWISWKNVIIASKKQMVNGDVLVDDGIHNLVGGSYEKILMTAPHNKDVDLKEFSGIKRANSWLDVYNIIQKIKRERQQL